MAVERIDFAIGSKFNKAGFQELDKTVTGVGGAANKAREAFSQMASVVSGFGGYTADAVSAIDTIAKSTMQFGAAGAVIGTAAAGLNFYQTYAENYVKELEEKSRALTQSTHDKIHAKFSADVVAIKDKLAEAANGAKRLSTEFEEAAAIAQKMAQMDIKISGEEIKTQIAQLEIDKTQAVLNAMTEGGTKLIEAQLNLEIAQEKLKLAKEQQGKIVTAAMQRESDSSKAVTLANNSVAEALEAKKVAEEKMSKWIDAETGKLVSWATEDEVFRKEYLRVKAEAEKADKAYAEAVKHQKKVVGEYTAAQGDAKIAVQQAQQAEIAAKNELIRAEHESMSVIKRKSELEEEYAHLMIEKNHLTDHENALQEEILELEERILQAEKARERQNAGMEADHRVNDFGPAYQYNLDANGNVRDFVDWQRAQRYAGRAARDDAAADRGNAAFERRANDLLQKQKDGKRLSNAEQEFLDQWKKFNDQKNQKDLEKQQQEKQAEMMQNVDKISKNTEDIKKNLAESLELK